MQTTQTYQTPGAPFQTDLELVKSRLLEIKTDLEAMAYHGWNSMHRAAGKDFKSEFENDRQAAIQEIGEMLGTIKKWWEGE